MKSYKFLLTLAIAAASFGVAQANQLGVDFTSVGNNYSNGYWTLGYEFSVSAPVTVTGLGVFTSSTDAWAALPATQEAGLWTSEGTLLASTWIDAGTVPTLGNGFFATASIAPVVLDAGTYIVGATNSDFTYSYNNGGFSQAPGITFIQDEYVSGDALQMPTSSSGITSGDGGAWFGGNIVIGASTPDTCPTWLLATIALATMAALRRRVAALV